MVQKVLCNATFEFEAVVNATLDPFVVLIAAAQNPSKRRRILLPPPARAQDPVASVNEACVERENVMHARHVHCRA